MHRVSNRALGFTRQVLRLGLAVVLLGAGVLKALDVEGTAWVLRDVASAWQGSVRPFVPLAILVSVCEIGVGASIVFGSARVVRCAALAGAAGFLGYGLFVGWMCAAGESPPVCGCFGAWSPVGVSCSGQMIRSAVMFAWAVSVAAGARRRCGDGVPRDTRHGLLKTERVSP